MDRAVQRSAWGLVTIGFISVAREGIETTLFLWSAIRSMGNGSGAALGALAGLLTAVVLGWLIYRGMVKINLAIFFRWTGAFLVIVAAGVLAYGVHDLQEAGFLPGPFTAAAPIDPETGFVLIGFGAFPFGWAFDISHIIAPDGFLGALLKGTIGFTPAMTWLEILVWASYLAIVGTMFVRRAFGSPRPPATSHSPTSVPPTSVAAAPSTMTTDGETLAATEGAA